MKTNTLFPTHNIGISSADLHMEIARETLGKISSGIVSSIKFRDGTELTDFATEPARRIWGDLWTISADRKRRTEERLSKLPALTFKKNNQVITRTKGKNLDYKITRYATRDFIEEDYFIKASKNLDLPTFGIFFWPEIPPFRYHWFTADEYGFLLFSHEKGKRNMAMVLVEGKLNGLENPQGLEDIRLVYTDSLHHPDDDEYKQPRIKLKKGHSLRIRMRYFTFVDWPDLGEKIQRICAQPIFEFERAVEIGKTFRLNITAPQGVVVKQVDIDGLPIRLNKCKSNSPKTNFYELSEPVKASGLHKVNIYYQVKRQMKHCFVLFFGMHDLKDLLQKRSEVILSKQMCKNSRDKRYAGIFPYDFVERKIFSSDSPYIGQWGGTGEVLSSAILILMKNNLSNNYHQGEIELIELHANEYVKKKIQRGGNDGLINPLAKNPSWRMNGYGNTYIAKEYLELSKISQKYLRRQKRNTYLLWAYQTLHYTFRHYPTVSGYGCIYVTPQVIEELQKRKFVKEARILKRDWNNYVKRIKKKGLNWEPGITEIEGVIDDAGICPVLTTIFQHEIEKEKRKEALRDLDKYIDNTSTLLGYSYDPRLQSAFRYWESGGETCHYALRKMLCMPTLWTQEPAVSMLEVYRASSNYSYLRQAYDTMMNFYTLYDFNYKFNAWPGSLKIGEASGAYYPVLYYCLSPSYLEEDISDTLDGGAGSQDLCFVDYLETFGKECFATPEGKLVNIDKVNNKYISRAVYPTKYTLGNYSISIEQGAKIKWVEINQEGLRLCLEGSGIKAMYISGLKANKRYTITSKGLFPQSIVSSQKGILLIKLKLTRKRGQAHFIIRTIH